MLFRQLLTPRSQRLSYLVADQRGGEALLIDPHPSQRTVVKALLSDCQLRLKAELFTHHHGLQPADGHRPHSLHLGRFPVHTLPTPGHTRADVCYLWQDRLFSGDTLHPAGCPAPLADSLPGRWFDSVTRELFTLPDETLVFPGHLSDGRTVSTIGEERRRNVFFSGVSRESFIARFQRLRTAES